MWEGSMPEGVSLSQALGEEGQTSGGECKCIRSFILVTFSVPSAVLPSTVPVLLLSFLSNPVVDFDQSAQGVVGSPLVQ